MAVAQSEATPAPAAGEAAPAAAAAPAPAVSEEVAAEAKRIKDEGNAFFAGESRSRVGARPFARGVPGSCCERQLRAFPAPATRRERGCASWGGASAGKLKREPSRGGAELIRPLAPAALGSGARAQCHCELRLPVAVLPVAAAKQFARAVEAYSRSIEMHELAPVLGNRAFAQLKMESFGAAIADASRALELDPRYIKGYYRRGSANLALGKHKAARRDFRICVRARPTDASVKKQLDLCESEIRRAAFEAAIVTDKTAGVWDTLEAACAELEIPASYSGPRLGPDGRVTRAYCRELMQHMRDQKLPPKHDVWVMLRQAYADLRSLPSLIRVPIPEAADPSADGGAASSSSGTAKDKDEDEEARGDQADGCVCVMGDTHGQYYDTLNIFRLTGEPCRSRALLFNGDFVDRGSFSVENMLCLLAWRLACPDRLFLLRGNHETVNMNKMYGFEGEVRHKYDDKTMELFGDLFRALPLAAVVGGRAMVCHGGLFTEDGIKLDQIESTPRFREPPESGIMSDILWSDPQPFRGRGPSKRGVGMSFGPDITAAFLDLNGLEILIRSHEVKDEGYVVEHAGRCITVFSAPNYCDQMGNKGAFIRLRAEGDPEFNKFTAVPHPPVPPMRYAGMGMLGGLGM